MPSCVRNICTKNIKISISFSKLQSIMSQMFLALLFILTLISSVLIYLKSVDAHVGRRGHLMASCRKYSYQNL